MSANEPRRATTQDFRRTYAEDRRRGRRRSLTEYLSLFPEDDVTVAEEYLSLERNVDALSGDGVSDSQPSAPNRIGPYVLHQEIGRGGQGRVYRAEDTRLNREVALKLLDLDAQDAEELLLRFRREAEVTSQLDHPGLCPIHEADTADGFAYIAMPLLEGETLADRIRRERLDALTGGEDFFEFASGGTRSEIASAESEVRGPREKRALRGIARDIERAARAIHAAHEAGVIHRDVKPGNVMITPDGRSVVLDFGLARRAEDARHALTQIGKSYGSPAYAAPESLNGQNTDPDRAEDVWALGVTLYECLAWQRPFRAANREALAALITSEAPPALRELNSAIPNDLAMIVETALQKDPEQRYATALDLADDLRRFLSYEPIAARPVGLGTRFVQWCRRRPLTAASLLCIWILLSCGFAMTGWFLKKEAEHAQQLEEALGAVERENAEKEALLVKLRDRQDEQAARFEFALFRDSLPEATRVLWKESEDRDLLR